MKKIGLILIAVITFFSCEPTPEFDNYKYTSVYFPHQFPMRTLVLGDFEYDNTLDKNFQFNIGVALGGLRSNETEKWVKLEIDNSMVDGFAFSNGDVLEVLPSAYYSTSPAIGEKVMIPKGSMEGKMLITLKPEFFTDVNTVNNRYVIPVKIVEVSEGIDTVLQGNTTVSNPKLINVSQWDVSPKNFTLFGIKYTNEYHGNYLHYGVDYTLDGTGAKLDYPTPAKYSTRFIEQNQLWMLKSSGRSTITTNGVGSSTNSSMKLILNSDNTVSLQAVSGTKVIDATKSSGTFVKNGGKWGDKNQDAFFLNYQYTETRKIVEEVESNRFTATGTWVKTVDANANGGNLFSSAVTGDSFTYNFYGSTLALYGRTAPTTAIAYGTFDVYIDNMTTPLATNITTVSTALTNKKKLYEKLDLAMGQHTLKVVLKQAKATHFDYVEFGGTYKQQVSDTLVYRDKGVTFETFSIKVK